MKLVVNRCYGGFSLSDEALSMLGFEYQYDAWDLDRNDPRLVEVVETLGQAADGRCARLAVVTLPENATDYHVDDYDGYESVIYVVGGKLCWA